MRKLNTVKKQIMLHPGDLSLTRKAAEVATILGSCISFTMLHRESQMAAMCHCLLATTPQNKALIGDRSPFFYVDSAFREMVRFFAQDGISPEDIEVKLFGGADVLKVLSDRKTVGQDNIESSHALLKKHGLQLSAYDIGGKVGRKIVFMTDTGSVMVRKLGATNV